MSSKRTKKAYESLTPSFLIPNHFNCNQETTMVALYDEPIGGEHESITLLFPGDMAGSAPRYVTPRKVGHHSVVFRTPVYSTSRGQVEVSPILTMRNGEKIPLGKFRLTLKHPLTTVMELCMKLSSSSAVLPVLTTLMLNVDKDGDKAHFTDSHTDRVMTLLVGSMKPGTSSTIKDLLLPDKKWKKKNLTDLAREFGLRNMEKEAYMVTAAQRKPPTALKRSETMFKNDHDDKDVRDRETSPLSDDAHNNAQGGGMTASFSSPSINTVGLDDELEPVDTGRVFMTNQLRNSRERVRVVTQNFRSREPGKLSLKAGERVYVITSKSSEAGWWYGACEGRHGIFPSWCVAPPYEVQRSRLPLPPLPKREPMPSTVSDKRSSPPFIPPRGNSMCLTRKENHTRHMVSAKTYRKSEKRNQPQSHDRLGSQELLLNDSGDYVDMVAQQQGLSSSSGEDSDSELSSQFPSAEEGTVASNLHQAARLPNVYQTPPLPQIASTPECHPVTSKKKSTPPAPPMRTSSMISSPSIHVQATKTKELSSDSDEDAHDYMNIDEQGLSIEPKKRPKAYENVIPLGFEAGQTCDQKILTSPLRQEKAPAMMEPAHAQRHMTTSTGGFQVDQQEFEKRRQARLLRHAGRKTHEKVILATPTVNPPPTPHPRQLNTPGGPTEESPIAATRSNWLKHELEARMSSSADRRFPG